MIGDDKVFLAFESSKVKSDTILFNLKELNKLSPIQSPILDNNCATLGFELSESILTLIAGKSRGTPRIANRLLKILRDYHTIGKDIADIPTLKTIFRDIGIDDK